MSLNEQTENIKVAKNPKGRPRIFPLDPLTGLSTYVDTRIHNKIECPVCFQQIMECNLSSHKKTKKCKRVGELLALREKIKV